MLQISEFSIMKTIRNSTFLLLFCSLSVYSQQADFQSWTSFKLSKKVYKRTNISVKEGVRFRENSSLIKKVFTDLKLSHRIKKTDLEISIGYRLADEYDITFSSEYKYRYYCDFTNDYKFKRFTFSFRERLQLQGKNTYFTPLFRQKVEMSYNVRKTPFKPYVQLELFINFDDQLEKMRYTAGFSHPLTKDLNATLFYRIQQEFNTSIRENLFILGTSLSYKL